MRHRIGSGLLIVVVTFFLALSSAYGALPVGPLSLDGPATPEQLSLVLPITGTLVSTATASVRYRVSGTSTWIAGHALYRVKPAYSEAPAVGGAIEDVFAWPIIDLTPGARYDIEVTVSDGATSETRSASFTTRALPDAAEPSGSGTLKTVPAGATTGQIQALLDGLNPGDVLEFQSGTYNLTSELALSRSGSEADPIYIRGASRTGTTLSRNMWGRIIDWRDANDVVLENMTLQGTGYDAGTGYPSGNSVGIQGRDLWTGRTRGTIRNLTITGIDMGIVFDDEVTGFLIYDNSLDGNNSWTQDLYAYGASGTPGAGDGTLDIDQNLMWNDDGIRAPGTGNAVWQNTIRDFGDSISIAHHGGGSGFTDVRGVHYYRNEIRNSCDDAIEVDYGRRNVTFYDNRVTNSMTTTSLDPLHGGPFLAARNVYVNVGRTLHKWNSTNSGMFIYNNTTVQTVGRQELIQSNIGGWYQPNNGAQRDYGFRNNILIYRTGGSVNFPWIESPGHDPVDWTHNSWYPDGRCQAFGWAQTSLTALIQQQATISTSPVVSGQTHRMTQDNTTVSDPFVTDMVLGANYRTEITTLYTPTLSAGTAPKNSGVAIANITDGYSGAAPDRGAIVSGRAPTIWGDQSLVPSAPPRPTGLVAN